MKNRFHRPARRGAALIIVLAFVTLLAVLVLGFFGRALLDQQISTSSSNRSKVDLFAEGAVDCISGDLKQEIVDGSVSQPAAGGTYTVYVPKVASSMVPNYALGTLTSSNVPNLLKMSSNGVSFYSGGSAYSQSGTARASSALTTTPSLNNRSISLADWNKALLLSVPAGQISATSVDTTPAASTGLTNATAPDWVLVAKDGSNPTGWNANLEDIPLNKGAATPVVGRYAYTIYDEGGLLDANVAGFHPNNNVADSYKNFLAFADLTQVGFKQTDIDQLAGWRNYASAAYDPIKGISSPFAQPFPSFTWSKANSLNYFNNLLANTTGFLHVSSPAVVNNQTDHQFTSRQQLIQLLTAIGNKTGNLAADLNALQYFGTFSRSLNQPSYIPPVNNPNITGAPVTAAQTTIKGTAGTGSNTANGADAKINPSFLSVTVQNTFIRNDGTTAKVGDPLVKKRFNLHRLAWLTYKGPICDGHDSSAATKASDLNGDADIQILATQLHQYYGLSWTFLQQGTKANIYNYFGLSWVQDTRGPVPEGDNQYKWLYNHTQANSNGPYAALPAGGGFILPLQTVNAVKGINALPAAQAREPDFVELLQAGIAAGSKAKPATMYLGNITGGQSQFTITAKMPDNIQNQRDSSLNFALIQIVANIIDQYDLDGYPTRILYNDGAIGYALEFYGVENLPYFYRARSACLQQALTVATEGPVSPSAPAAPYSAGSYTPGKGNITSPGVFSFLQIPEIWNPHDQNSPRCALDPSTNQPLQDHTGNAMCPTSFRLVADSIDPDNITSNLNNIGLYDQVGGYCSDAYNPQKTAGYDSPAKMSTTYPTDAAGSMTPWPISQLGLQQMQYSSSKPFPVCAESSALTFNVPSTKLGDGLFREPTLLYKANLPQGSNLLAAGKYNPLLVAGTSSLPGGASLGTSPYNDPFIMDFISTGATVVDPSGKGLKDYLGVPYLGIYIGTSPGAWYVYTPDTTDSPQPTPIPPALPGPSMPICAADPPVNMKYKFADVATEWDTRLYIGAAANHNFQIADSFVLTYRMQYNNSYDSNPGWSTYDCKYGISGSRNGIPNGAIGGTAQPNPTATFLMGSLTPVVATDPRTSRFSLLHTQDIPPPGYSTIQAKTYGWLDTANFTVLVSARPDASNGYWGDGYGTNESADGMPETYGWITSGNGNVNTGALAPMGLTAQNDPDYKLLNGSVASAGTPTGTSIPTVRSGIVVGTASQYYGDPDGVVRRGMAAYMNGVVGQPLATANTSPNGVEVASGTQPQSRPIILNRPFKSVAELGYVFSGTPWKNLDFFTPESGDSGLLDLFSLGETTDPTGLIAGKVNLNTQQPLVLQAILSRAYQDEQNNYAIPPNGTITYLTAAESGQVANLLIKRTSPTNTTSGQGPLQNVSELVGKYVSTVTLTDPNNAANIVIDGSKSYNGFSTDLSTINFSNASAANIQRFRESTVRALSAAGQVRVWNVMIDLVAQTGRYPAAAQKADDFVVDGQQHYWVHLAIDRMTGQVLDKQVEIVK